jgi:hypothetical protein
MKKGPDTHVSLPPSVIAMMPEMNDEDEWFLGDIAVGLGYKPVFEVVTNTWVGIHRAAPIRRELRTSRLHL